MKRTAVIFYGSVAAVVAGIWLSPTQRDTSLTDTPVTTTPSATDESSLRSRPVLSTPSPAEGNRVSEGSRAEQQEEVELNRELLKTIGSLSTEANVDTLTSAQLQEILRQHGVETSLARAGNPETGVRIELSGENASRGLLEVKAVFDLTTDGREQVARLQFSLPPGKDILKSVQTELQEKLGQDIPPARSTDSVARWELPDGWAVWAKDFSEEDPYWGKNKSSVVLTRVHIVE